MKVTNALRDLASSSDKYRQSRALVLQYGAVGHRYLALYET